MINKMLLIRKVIDLNIENNEWLGEFETLLAEIEDNLETKPDISIESCKSLLESTAINILCRLEPLYSFESKGRSVEFSKLLKDAKDRLLEKIDDESITGFASTINIPALNPTANFICKIRNERGDISHGRILPKIHKSSIHLALTIKAFTDTFTSHLLYLLLSIDLSFKEEIQYEANSDFNSFLDDENYIEGIIYSKALFDQDPVAYEEQLKDYQVLKEIEEESSVEYFVETGLDK